MPSYSHIRALALIALVATLAPCAPLEGGRVMLMGAWNIGKRASGGVDPAYREVEYIQSDGSAYLATGLTIDLSGVDWSFDVETGRILNYSSHQFLFGAVYGTDALGVTQGSYFNLRPGWNITAFRDVYSANERLMLRLRKSGTSATLDVNEDAVISANVSTGTSGVLYIFGSPLSSYTKPLFPYKIYGASSGLGDFNLVPVARKSDSVGGMYDTVSRTFIGPTDGSFVVGPDKT